MERGRLVADLCRQHEVTIVASAMGGAWNTERPEGARLLSVEDSTLGGLECSMSGEEWSADCVRFAVAGRFDTPFHQALLRELPGADLVVHETPLSALYDLTIGFDGTPRVYLGREGAAPVDDAGRFVAALHRLLASRCLHASNADRNGPGGADTAASLIAAGLAESGSDGVEPRHILHLNDFDPRVRSGGGVRMRSLLQDSGRRLPTILLCLSGSRRIEVSELVDGVVLIAVPKTDRHRERERPAESSGRVPVADILAYEEAPRNETLRLLYALLRTGAAETILEHCYMAGLPAAFADRIVYSSYNDELALKSELLATHPERDRLLAVVEEAECWCLGAADRVVATTEADLRSFETRLGGNRPMMQVVPNVAEAPVEPRADDLRSAAAMGPRGVVFIGSAHPPNIEAAAFIVGTLAPNLPQAEFHIIGSVGTAFPEVPPNVICWGEVSNSLKSALMRRAVLAVNPVRSGGGSNVKLADYLAHDLPVVAFAFGVRGYADTASIRLSISYDADQFVSNVKRLSVRR